MNLRKLLCGLLAVCLLMTVAPAALMEDIEAPVSEVMDVVGEAAEAEDIMVQPENPATDPVDSTKVGLFDEYYNPLEDTEEIKLTDYAADGFVVNFASTGTLGTVTWSISSKVAATPVKIDATTYVFFPKKAGKIKIKATDSKSKKSAEFTLKVIDDTKKASSIKIVPNPDDDEYSSKDGTWTCVVKDDVLVLMADVKPYSNSYPVTWTLDKISYATLSDGLVTGKKEIKNVDSNSAVLLVYTGVAGTVKITAKAGKQKTTLKIKVGPDSKKGITFKWGNSSVNFTSDMTEARYKLWGYNGSKKKFEKNSFKVQAFGVGKASPSVPITKANDLRSFAWKSANKSVATVAKTGIPGQAKISLKKEGRAKITVSKKDWASNSFTVVVADNGPTGVKYVDNYVLPFINDEVEVKEVELHKGQVATLVNMVDVEFGSGIGAGDPAYDNIFKKGGLTFSLKGESAVKLLDKNTGKIKGTTVGKTAYVWVKTFNGKEDYLKVKVVK